MHRSEEGESRRDGETSDFRQNGLETFRNYCSFEGAITECRSKRRRRGNIWRTMFTAETPGCFKCKVVWQRSLWLVALLC